MCRLPRCVIRCRHSAIKALILVMALFLSPQQARAGLEDQHAVKAIVSVLQSAIPSEVLRQARDYDDQLMSQGKTQDGVNVYLVTDKRSSDVNALVEKLLVSMGEDPTKWVVRVLDTDEPVVNAFVVGGKYIYVFTGFLDQATSDDEIAVVLSHELGHSLLQHNTRQKKDGSSVLAGLASLAAMLSDENSESFMNVARVVMASYSQLDEEEADAIGVAIARRAGFDPLRGADFFSRMKREKNKAQNGKLQELDGVLQQVEQGQMTCQQVTGQYNSSWEYQTSENYQTVTQICGDAETQRLYYNQLTEQYNAALDQQQLGSLFNDHPADQNRVAAIAALNDYLAGRRDLQSIAKYEQSHRVMVALNQIDSVLLKAPVKPDLKVSAKDASQPQRQATTRGLADQLQDLKRALDQGFITRAEYERKRTDVVERY